MSNGDFPSFGFTVSWNFRKHEEADGFSLDRILDDVEVVLAICRKHDLLYPTHYLESGPQPIPLDDGDPRVVTDFLRHEIRSKDLRGEITSIGGYGTVHIGAGRTARQDDLLTIDSIRLFEYNFTLETRVNCWTPLFMDKDYMFHWQVELAQLNATRLERCLREVHDSLDYEVVPDVDELDSDNPVWQKGFRLYWNPQILRREYRDAPPPGPFDLEEYLISK